MQKCHQSFKSPVYEPRTMCQKSSLGKIQLNKKYSTAMCNEVFQHMVRIIKMRALKISIVLFGAVSPKT